MIVLNNCRKSYSLKYKLAGVVMLFFSNAFLVASMQLNLNKFPLFVCKIHSVKNLVVKSNYNSVMWTFTNSSLTQQQAPTSRPRYKENCNIIMLLTLMNNYETFWETLVSKYSNILEDPNSVYIYFIFGFDVTYIINMNYIKMFFHVINCPFVKESLNFIPNLLYFQMCKTTFHRLRKADDFFSLHQHFEKISEKKEIFIHISNSLILSFFQRNHRYHEVFHLQQ